jgi:hypothetical protein
MNILPKELLTIIFEYSREYSFLDEYKKLIQNEPACKVFESMFITKIPRICSSLYIDDYSDIYDMKRCRLYKPLSMQQHTTALIVHNDLPKYIPLVYSSFAHKWRRLY